MEKAYLITQNTNLKQDFSLYDRLYIGDSYCEHNLIYFIEDKKFIKNVLELNKKISLTTPILSKKGIDKLFNFIKKYQDINGFEIIINDFGVFYKIKKEYSNIKIIWGNFLCGQNKDPYLKTFVDKELHKNISIDSTYYKKLFKENKIYDIELYNVFQGFNIQNNYNIHMHFPFVIYSITRYCINNLISNSINYLTIVEKCNGCKKNSKNNLKHTINLEKEKISNYYIGNKQFYENKNIINKNKISRIIYNYDLLKDDGQKL